MEGTDAVRVLLLDDDPDCANSTAMLFRHFGAEVRTSTILGWRATKRARSSPI